MEIEYEIDTLKLENSLNLLAQNSNLLISQLERDQIYEAYIYVKDMVNKLYNTDNYEMILNIIKKQYRPTVIYPGTLASYLWGCFSTYYGTINNQNCSPLCINAIPSMDQKVGCHYQIWDYTWGELRKKVDNNTDKAYIYVNNEWKGFTKEEIDILKGNHINFATILSTENTKHYIKIPMVDIHEIPIINISEDEIYLGNSKSSNLYVYIFFLLIMIGIGFILRFSLNNFKENL